MLETIPLKNLSPQKISEMKDAWRARGFTVEQQRIGEDNETLVCTRLPPQKRRRKGGSRPSRAWTQAEIGLLGTDTDANVAKVLKVATFTVRLQRALLGIPSNDKRKRQEMALLFGKKTDKDIAKQVGRCYTTVLKVRKSLGIRSVRPPRKPRIDEWPREVVDRLGTVPDSVIAKERGVKVQAVQFQRAKRGISAFLPHHRWAPEGIARLGQAPDQVIADELGLTLYVARAKRRKLGIPEFTPPSLPWDGLLGKISDNEIARRYGIRVQTVAYRRHKKGIPALFKTTPWTADMDAMLGTESDASLARIFGIRGHVVGLRRRKLGIAAVDNHGQKTRKSK